MLWRTSSELRISSSPGDITRTCGTNSQPFWSRTAVFAGLAPLASGTETTAFAQPLAGADDDLDDLLLLAAHLGVLVDLETFGAGAAPVNFTSPLMVPPPWALTGGPEIRATTRRDDRDGQHANDDRLLH